MIGYDDSRGAEIDNLFIHVETKGDEKHFHLSAYFVAKSNETKHVVRVMDLDTLNVIAPTTLIEDFEDGVWWTMHYDRSVRLRLVDLKGLRISALAFST